MITSNVKKLFKQIILNSGIYVSGTAESFKINKFFSRIIPIAVECGMVRIGDKADGGYLVPNDLWGIDACFSPGVSSEASFELMLAKQGIQCYLADYSVNKPPFEHKNFDFEKKYLGPENKNEFMTLESWMKKKRPSGGEFILQMDIEGAEYGVLLSTPINVLIQYRILVIEFHELNSIFGSSGIELIDLTFQKILEYFSIVHIHPNNCLKPVKLKNIAIPPVMEFTFLRKDRVTNSQRLTNFPHPLDVKNAPNLPDVLLPECWTNNSQIFK
jgi:hypothetical protein